MKSIAMIAVSAILGVMTLMMVFSISGRMSRETELESGLSAAVEETVATLAGDDDDGASDNEAYLAEFMEQLVEISDADSAMTVEVFACDGEAGILSVRVIEEFSYPNGNTGSIESERTAVRDQTVEDEKETYTVRFFSGMEDGEYVECYKTYTVQEGDFLTCSAEPYSEEASFAGWVDEAGNVADFAEPVMENARYYAIWE